MAGGSTRTGLINRGMVHPKGSERFGKLTETGLQARAKMLPAPAAPAATVTPVTVPFVESGQGLTNWAGRQVQGAILEPEEAMDEAPRMPEVEDEVAPEGGYLEPIRTRYHGKTLGQRRQARKNQRAARRRTRGKNR
jgi:hypothetical protein